MRRPRSDLERLLRDAEQASRQKALLNVAGEEVLQRTRLVGLAIAKQVVQLTETPRVQHSGGDGDRPDEVRRRSGTPS